MTLTSWGQRESHGEQLECYQSALLFWTNKVTNRTGTATFESVGDFAQRTPGSGVYMMQWHFTGAACPIPLFKDMPRECEGRLRWRLLRHAQYHSRSFLNLILELPDEAKIIINFLGGDIDDFQLDFAVNLLKPQWEIVFTFWTFKTNYFWRKFPNKKSSNYEFNRRLVEFRSAIPTYYCGWKYFHLTTIICMSFK